MEVVCLILCLMLASQPFSHAFWVLTSLHLLSFLLKMFFIILISIAFFFLNGVNIFCRLQKYWCELYIMKSYNHIFIKICSSMKVSRLYISFIYAFFFTYRWYLFSISLTELSAVLVSVTVSTIQYSNAYHSI